MAATVLALLMVFFFLIPYSQSSEQNINVIAHCNVKVQKIETRSGGRKGRGGRVGMLVASSYKVRNPDRKTSSNHNGNQ